MLWPALEGKYPRRSMCLYLFMARFFFQTSVILITLLMILPSEYGMDFQDFQWRVVGLGLYIHFSHKYFTKDALSESHHLNWQNYLWPFGHEGVNITVTVFWIPSKLRFFSIII